MGLNGLDDPTGYSVSLNDVGAITKAAKAARAAGADLVVVHSQIGQEYETTPDKEQVSYAQDLADSGQVDILFGAHPHVPQPAEKLSGGVKGKGMWVSYSAGNYISNQDEECCAPLSDVGQLVWADVTSHADGSVSVDKLNWHPFTVDQGAGYKVRDLAALHNGERPASLSLDEEEIEVYDVAARGLKANWGASSMLMASGAVEPVLYLLAMGIGLGAFIGQVQSGTSYAAWIAPALLATSALNGAVMDATWNVFMKLKFDKLYETMLSTSLGPLDVALGEITVALVRGGIYATSFVAVMALLGLVGSWWVLLAIPACLLIAFGIAALGMAATSFCRTFQQMDWIMLVLMPMFMFSGTFYPVDVYPAPIAAAVKCLPLWHGIEMLRDLNAGAVSWLTAGHALYFVVLAVLGVWVASLRLKALFLR